jgi:putative acetyltransferase
MKRLATPADFLAVHAIYMHPTVVPFLGHEPQSIEDFEPIFGDLCNRKSFYVYEQGGEVAGFYHLSRHAGRSSHVAYLGTFAVNPKVHGRGIGRRMLTELINELRANGIRRIELIVESDNAKALALYHKLGFVIEGTLRKFYKRAADAEYLDDHYMGLLLE